MSDTIRNRPSPDALLAQATAETRGKLKIYLGAAPGVGKTYEMLSDARKKHADGVDVVAGIVETHGRIETQQLCDDLTILPRQKVAYKGRELEEMDLDALLKRRPAIALVDELAHTNAEGSRHPKRWMDVEELIAAGIDVWTTLNIQHVESLNDIVARITRVRVRETVPDAIIERADEIELIDLTPDQLIERLREGKVYAPDQARRALRHYFAPGNLSALRELAMRRAADRIDIQVRGFRQAQGETVPWAAHERFLVCVDEREASAEVVRHTKRLADRARATWVAVHVQTGRDRALSAVERSRLNDTLRLATRLGAETATLPGDRVSDTILSYAGEQNVTQIVVGKARRPMLFTTIFGSVVSDLINHSETIAVHVVPQEIAAAKRQKPAFAPPSSTLTPRGLAEAAVTTAAAIGVAVPLDRWLGVPNPGLIFLAPVLISALRSGLGPALMAAAFSVLAYDFFFTDPRFSFTVYDPRAVVSLIVFGAAAIVVSSLAARARDQTLAARTEARTSRELLNLARGLAAVAGEDEVARTLAVYTARAFDADCVVFARVWSQRIATWRPPRPVGTPVLTDADMAAVHWTMDKGTPAVEGHRYALGRAMVLYSAAHGVPPGYFPACWPSRATPSYRRAERRRAWMRWPIIRRLIGVGTRPYRASLRRKLGWKWTRRNCARPCWHRCRTICGHRSPAYWARCPRCALYGERPRSRYPGRNCWPRSESEADRMQRYVVKLLDMTRLDAGGLKARQEALEVSDIVSSVMKRAEARSPIWCPPGGRSGAGIAHGEGRRSITSHQAL